MDADLRNWHKTWATYAAAMACAILFLANGFAWDFIDEETELWGWRAAQDVWGGDWWALITSAFVHIEIWHVGFNLYWLFYLGRPIERAIGPWRWWLLVLVSAFVSSTCEMAVSDDMGIGMSGVIYALFGFMWVAKRRWPDFAKFVDQQTATWLFGWLVLCFFLTYTDVWAVGNWAHLSGLVIGACIGAAAAFTDKRWLFATAASVLIAACVGVLFWAPWSPAWTGHKAYALDDAGRQDEAIKWYRRCLELDPDQAWALYNLGLIHYKRDEPEQLEQVLAKLRTLDPDTAEELENIAREPDSPAD